MFDTEVRIETDNIANALKAIAGLGIKPEQLKQTKIKDDKGRIGYIAKGLISRIDTTTFYNPTRKVAQIHYINGDIFGVDLSIDNLAVQLNINTTN